jgi:branched-chain amino acid transport system ATP-binding protein/branched-chain amino acid transport system permease protein
MSRARFRSPTSAATSLFAPLALVAAVVLIGIGSSPSFQGVVMQALCSMVMVLGLQVFIGNSGIYSFGQLGFSTAGAYLAALLTLPGVLLALQTPGLPKWIADAQLGPLTSTLAAALCAGLLATAVGPPLMRTSSLAIPISTFAFLIVVYEVTANWEAVTGGSNGLVNIPTTTGLESAGLWAGLAVIVALAFKWSASGYRLQATREDEVAARSLGIHLMRERLGAFVLSGALCGLGGALAVHQSGVLSPATFYFGATVTTVTMLVVGGARSVLGAVIGTIAVASVNELLRGLENGASLFGAVSIGETPGLAAIGLGVILLGTIVALPDGISGGREAGELAPGLHRRPRATPADAAHTRRESAAVQGVLAAEAVTLSFAGLRVLRGVDLELRSGEALGLIGPNGAGKTTLLNVISGFQAPDSGRVSIDGTNVTGRSPDRLARVGLGRTFQAALPFPHLNSLESVAVGAMGIGTNRKQAASAATEVLVRLGMLDRAERPAGSLPPGEQRLLGIARALATRPRFLLLDEPAAGLNDHEREELITILDGVLTDFGCGILLIEHDINVISRLCPRVQVLDEGETLRIGSPEEVIADPAVIESYLGSSFAEAAHA